MPLIVGSTNATNPAEVLEDYEQGQWNAAVSSTSGTDTDS